MTAADHRDPDPHRVPRGAGREAIAAAAGEVFSERGYHGASIRDIAQRAGLSLSALYYWHPSKQHLLVSLIEDHARDYLSRCAAALQGAADEPAAQLAAVVRATVAYRAEQQVESGITHREWRNLEPDGEARLRALRRRAREVWSDVINEGVRQGVFGCPYPTDARRAAQAACNAVVDWYSPGGPTGVDELCDRYVDIVLRIVDHRGRDRFGRG